MANTVKIILDNVVGAFYPGQTLSGRVECFFDEEKKIRAVRLRFKGCAKTRWSRSSGKSSTTYRAKEIYFDQAYNLIGGGEDIELNAGRHTYPFSYILPAPLPASFEGRFGTVRYTIKATVDRPWKTDYTEKIGLNVFTPFDLNLMPAFRNPNAISVEKEVRSFCCQTDPIMLNISLPITGYAIGQQIDVRAAIKNMSNVTIESVQFRIMRVLQFISHEPYHRENYDEYPITSCAVGAIGAHADMEWTSSLTVPRDSCINLYPCSIINVEYHLEVEAVLPFPHTNLIGNFPIAIGSVPYSEINVGPIHPPQQTNFYPPYSPSSYPPNAGASAPLMASYSVNKSSSPSEKASIAVRLKFRGRAKTRWTKKRGKTNVIYRAREVYFDQEYNLIGGGEDIELNAGTHTYPFSYILPAILPASFEGKFGHVRYTIKAIVDRPWKFDYTQKITFSVFAPLDLNFMPAFQNSNAISVDKQVRSGCCGTEPLTLKISLPVMGYAIGQQIDVRAAINNMSNVNIENVQFRLMRVVQFIAYEPSNRENYDECPITSCAVGAIGAHADMEWTSSLTVPRDSCINLTPCSIINVEYHIEVEAVLPFPHTNLIGTVPIAIGSVPYSGINMGPIHPPQQQQTNVSPPHPCPSSSYPTKSYPSNADASAPLIGSYLVDKSSAPPKTP